MDESDNHVGVAPLLRRNWIAMLVAVFTTSSVQHLTYVFAAEALSSRDAVVLTLFVSLLWVVIAAPVFAAGGRTLMDGLLRGWAVIDASVVVLIVLVVTGGGVVGPAGAVRIYLVFCSLALAGCFLASLSRNVVNRHILAAVAILLILVVAAGPFWANGIIMSASPPWRERVAFGVRACNPVFATTECLTDGSAFVWNERPVLYEYTVLGRDVPVRAAAWYVTVGVYTIFALAVGAIAAVRRRQERHRLGRG